jgi:hypothetical protein
MKSMIWVNWTAASKRRRFRSDKAGFFKSDMNLPRAIDAVETFAELGPSLGLRSLGTKAAPD